MRILLLICLLLTAFFGHTFSIKQDYPKEYIVKQDDTLWNIASQYLDKPWEWHDLMNAPHVKNPERLYPGAVLALNYHKKRPYIRVVSNGFVKLSPHMRPMPDDQAIPAIPLSAIKPFLNGSLVMDVDLLDNAPYVVAMKGERLVGSQGDEVYVKNLHLLPGKPQGATISYNIYRPGKPYIEKPTGRFLGYKAILVGQAELVQGGQPASILITEVIDSIHKQDRVMYNDYPEYPLSFEPKLPEKLVRGTIIDLANDFTQGGAGMVVVINRGKDAGLVPGDVLAIYSKRRAVCDYKCPENPVMLPRERLGELMIFKTFCKTSFGLVMRSIRTITVADKVINP